MELKLENGRPADTTGRLEKEIRTYDFLDAIKNVHIVAVQKLHLFYTDILY